MAVLTQIKLVSIVPLGFNLTNIIESLFNFVHSQWENEIL